MASANPPAVQRVFREHGRLTSPPRTQGEQSSATDKTSTQRTRTPQEGVDQGGGVSSNTGANPSLQEDHDQPADLSLDMLRKDLEEGNISSETQLTVHVDYCTDTAAKALSVRHNPAKYRYLPFFSSLFVAVRARHSDVFMNITRGKLCCSEMAEQLQRAVVITFKGWRVSTQVTAHDWNAASSETPTSQIPSTTGKWSPPLGAFEVYLNWEVADSKRSVLLHSKLKTRKFPDTFACLATVVRLVGSHSALLTASEP